MGLGVGVGEAGAAVGASGGVKIGVNGVVVSATGDGEPGAVVGDGEGVAEGRNNVGEDCGGAISWVGSGRTPTASSWLNKNPPTSIPTLTSVMTRLPNSCLMPVD